MPSDAQIQRGLAGENPLPSAQTPKTLKTQPDPKAFWDACDTAGILSKYICNAIEKSLQTGNELLAFVCKIGFAVCCIGIVFGLKTGSADSFRDLAILYCAGIASSKMGDSYFDGTTVTSSLMIPLFIGVILYFLPLG